MQNHISSFHQNHIFNQVRSQHRCFFSTHQSDAVILINSYCSKTNITKMVFRQFACLVPQNALIDRVPHKILRLEVILAHNNLHTTILFHLDEKCLDHSAAVLPSLFMLNYQHNHFFGCSCLHRPSMNIRWSTKYIMHLLFDFIKHVCVWVAIGSKQSSSMKVTKKLLCYNCYFYPLNIVKIMVTYKIDFFWRQHKSRLVEQECTNSWTTW